MEQLIKLPGIEHIDHIDELIDFLSMIINYSEDFVCREEEKETLKHHINNLQKILDKYYAILRLL